MGEIKIKADVQNLNAGSGVVLNLDSDGWIIGPCADGKDHRADLSGVTFERSNLGSPWPSSVDRGSERASQLIFTIHEPVGEPNKADDKKPHVNIIEEWAEKYDTFQPPEEADEKPERHGLKLYWPKKGDPTPTDKLHKLLEAEIAHMTEFCDAVYEQTGTALNPGHTLELQTNDDNEITGLQFHITYTSHAPEEDE